ncbi:MAG TPA: cell division protein ZipA C-terminal FtsZ-binding domain-containing protein [Noviherbaspirillum sp.]|uniref:cell division protein ZipA C-terminal FtsZ-binding domain-containing protein n=1 Tax=Noviherbaspirillum sp. TaxID=1926288 RepID=UPI002B47A4C0|nr:cell division protein ZipA C-terminal FtsZ-binding domain-containing protein [Noviherbaspirillum sp.]HJV87103.1 cell division protein ZipA C-terminal FtsZ-binding domain-containing protein [Noviherbaspirillum sp.]
MTDLQASLMAIGGAIVVGVITYNKWQEYKARKSVQRAFSSEHDDVLMHPGPTPVETDGERHEPTFVAESAESAEPAGVTDAGDAPETTVREEKPAPRELPIDELIDCAISLVIEAPVRAEKILSKLQSLRHVGSKPVHFIAQREDGEWESVTHGGVYYGLYAGVQLANRGGALNELEYSELIMRLRQVCDEIDAEPDVPDMTEVMARARSLSQFVSEYDAQLSVNVQAKSTPWAISTLLAALERQGFDLRPDGRLVMPDGEGDILFSLSTNVTLAAETTSRLTLLLDVPRVAPSRDGFGAMIACAKMLAARLDGVVVDDGNQPLSDDALTEIADQVRDFYTQMEAAGITAGSTRALRLFS